MLRQFKHCKMGIKYPEKKQEHEIRNPDVAKQLTYIKKLYNLEIYKLGGRFLVALYRNKCSFNLHIIKF